MGKKLPTDLRFHRRLVPKIPKLKNKTTTIRNRTLAILTDAAAAISIARGESATGGFKILNATVVGRRLQRPSRAGTSDHAIHTLSDDNILYFFTLLDRNSKQYLRSSGRSSFCVLVIPPTTIYYNITWRFIYYMILHYYNRYRSFYNLCI